MDRGKGDIYRFMYVCEDGANGREGKGEGGGGDGTYFRTNMSLPDPIKDTQGCEK